MPSINRTLILTGPVKITHDSVVFYSKGDVVITPQFELFSVGTSMFGDIEKRMRSREFRIKFTPAGEWENLSVLWPSQGRSVGASIFDSKTLQLDTVAGERILFHNVAVIMPEIIGAVGETMVGEVEFIAVIANSTDPTNAAAYYTYSTGQTYGNDSTFDPAAIKTGYLAAAWGGSSPWDSFLTEGGWRIKPSMAIEAYKVDGVGVVDYRVSRGGLGCMAEATPVGPTDAQAIAAMNPTTALGASLASVANNLVLTATGVHIIVYAAILESFGDLAYGSRSRVGKCTWRAQRTIASNAIVAPIRVAAAAP